MGEQEKTTRPRARAQKRRGDETAYRARVRLWGGERLERAVGTWPAHPCTGAWPDSG